MAKTNPDIDKQKEFNKAAEEGNTTFREYSDILKSINEELGKKVSKVKDASSEYNSLTQIANKFIQQEEGILRLSDKQLDTLQKQAQTNLNNLAAIGKTLTVENARTDAELALLAAKEQEYQIEKEILAKIEEEVKVRKKSNELMGLGGGLISGLNSVAGKFSSSFKLDEVQKEMEQLADSIAKGEKAGNRLTVLGKGLTTAFKNLGTTLTDPVVVIGALLKGFNDIEKSQKEFRQLTGQNADAFRGLNNSITSTSEYIKGAVTLSKELGVNANVVFSEKTVTEVAELTDNMGMAAKEAANLAKFSKISGGELSKNLSNIEGSFKSFVKTNGVALNFGEVLKEAGTVTDAMAMSLGGTPEKIAAGVMEAKKLGLTLEQVDKIAGSLLDFESSISAELEAELLTGKDLNLENARAAALNNDIAGLTKEIGKNAEINAAFSTGNRIQQEAIAKSLGMSRDEMAKMIYQQKLQSGLTAEQASQAADISLEEAKRLTTQEQITAALEKMSQALAPVLSFVASLVSNSFVLYTVMGLIGTLIAAKVAQGFMSMAKSAKDIAGSFKSEGLMGGVKKAAGLDQAGDSLGKANDKTKGLNAQSGKAIKTWLTNLGKGLEALAKSFKAIGPTGFAYLAAGLALLTGAVIGLGFALKLAAPGLEAIGKIIGEVFKGIATVITAVADGFVKLLGAIKMENVSAMLLLGPALISAGAGLLVFAGGLAAATAIMAVGSLLGSPLDVILELAENANGIKTTADSLTQMAAALLGVSAALATIDTDKLDSLSEFATTNSFANAATGIVNAITAPINAIGNAIGGGGKDEATQKLDEIKTVLEQLLKKEGTVYIDSSKAGKAFTVGSYNLQ
jgi:biotin operon repressor